MKRILVCGGRDFENWMVFRDAMDAIAEEYFDRGPTDPCGNFNYQVTIIQGGARGVDQMAIDWCAINWCNFETYKAEWDLLGKKAGFVRNREMLRKGEPELVIAFPGGIGTRMMVDMAKKADLMVLEVKVTAEGFTYGTKSDVMEAGAEEYEMIMEMMENINVSKEEI